MSTQSSKPRYQRARQLPATWKRIRTFSHFWPLLTIIASVLVGNSLYILHIFNADPINYLSGIGSITRPGVIGGGTAADPNIGFTAQALGHLVASDWFHGHVPWWNPFEGLGSPLAGEMQAGAFYPPTLLLIFSNGQVYAHALVEAIAGIGTYLVLQRVGLGRMASTAGGIAFALNGTYSWFSHAPTNPVVFLPFLILGVEYAYSTSPAERRWGWRIMAIALAFSIYAGFPETTYIDGILAAVWCIVRAIQRRREGLRFVIEIGKGLSVGALLGAPIIVAFTGYLQQAFVGGHTGGFNHAALPGVAASQTLIPYLFGSINTLSTADPTPTLTVIWGNVGGFLTASLCVLALIGIAQKSHRPLKIGLLFWVILSLGRTYGLAPMDHIVNALPGMGDVAFFRYSDPSWEFAVIVLAAIGIDNLVAERVHRWWIIACSCSGLLAVMVAYMKARSLLHALKGATHLSAWSYGSVIWALSIITLIGLAAVIARGRQRGLILVCIVSIDTLAMFVVPQLSAPRVASLDSAPVKFLHEHLGQYRFYTFGPIAANYGSYFALSSLSTNDLPVPKLWASYVTHDLDTNANPIAFDGANRNNPLGPSGPQEFVSHLSAFENSGVKFLVTTPGVVFTDLPARVQLRRVFVDPSVQILELPSPKPMYSTESDKCTVRYVNIDSAHVDCRSPQTLIRRELFMMGWSAEVNGRSETVSRYSPIFQQVKVPSGTSTVVYNFTPPHTDAAVIAFLFGLLGIFVPSSWLERRKSTRHAAHAAKRATRSS